VLLFFGFPPMHAIAHTGLTVHRVNPTDESFDPLYELTAFSAVLLPTSQQRPPGDGEEVIR
jgi:hypothetical protein